ncbi:MAG: hypothetical protein KF833_16970 [Verrucomicrobiae bacterium]|nr:hypothetical protein [Verrucomicrobiae bacterium]
MSAAKAEVGEGAAGSPPEDRRGFLFRVARPVAGVALLGVTMMAWRGTGAGACERRAVCGFCPVSAGCELPEARHWRGDGREGGTP